MQHNNIPKKNVSTFDPTPRVEGVCKDRICACMVIYAPFLLFDMQNDTILSGKNVLIFWPPPYGLDRICAYTVLYAPFQLI